MTGHERLRGALVRAIRVPGILLLALVGIGMIAVAAGIVEPPSHHRDRAVWRVVTVVGVAISVFAAIRLHKAARCPACDAHLGSVMPVTTVFLLRRVQRARYCPMCGVDWRTKFEKSAR